MHKELDFFFRTHNYLVRNLGETLRRGLMDQINWGDRLIGITGERQVGKTTFLLDIARERFGAHDPSCLYVNLNQFSFTVVSLSNFVDLFISKGGRTLLLDQVFKYPDWAIELGRCIDKHPDLQIIFTGSSIIRKEDYAEELGNRCAFYSLSGFSLREFISLVSGVKLRPYSLEDILENHNDITNDVVKLINPNEYFQDYIHHGYYPFFTEHANYSENLLKNINMMLEVDVLFLRQIEQRFLHKLRKLFHLLSRTAPATVNISQLAKEIETSRATAMNYITYLSEAKLVNLLYKSEETNMKKPTLCYLCNTNIAYVMAPDPDAMTDMYKTFFLNQVKTVKPVSIGSRSQINFMVDGKHNFRISTNPTGRYRDDRYYVIRNLDTSQRRLIPLWLFGFLY